VPKWSGRLLHFRSHEPLVRTAMTVRHVQFLMTRRQGPVRSAQTGGYES
jgi:hypothetical protein